MYATSLPVSDIKQQDFESPNPFIFAVRTCMPESSAEPSAVELITGIAQALVDKPEEVSVQAVSHDAGTVIRLRVHPTDVGKVIGKQGRTARSLRTILGAVSVKLHHRYTLEIIEEHKMGQPAAPQES
jgi:predicted RNA-binding protein YlqC (UPF0109 family)